ncbi:hypothetical protein C8R47DRAFT_1239730 [Mycena vitilis]|nr:hypothetical protein C8R47DRAFT_1239730 [Mycena vitilis]
MDASVDITDILILAASWLNVALFTLELVLCRRYFQRPNRPLIYKAGVSALIFFDTICTLTICVNLCFVVLQINGDPVALLSPTSLTIFMTYCAAAVEQAILCHLYFSLTRNIFVTAFLGLLILAHMGLAFASGALILVLDSELSAALNTTTASSITCAATDVCIAIALSSRVWRLLSPTDVISARDSLARRFLLLSVSAGLIVASNTLIMMSLLLRHSPVFSFFFSCQGRVYSVTLLTNFLVGITFRPRSTTQATSTSRSPRHQPTSEIQFDAVQGYDSAGASRSPRQPDPRDSKSTPVSNTPSPYNYNLEAEWMQLEHRRPSIGGIRSEP